jgi:hypothetical protein
MRTIGTTLSANTRGLARQCFAELALNCSAHGRGVFKGPPPFLTHGQGDAEVAAMTKLMLAVGVVASLILADPMRLISYLGPEAQWLGWKIRTTLSTERAMPQVSSFMRGQ